MQSKLGLQAVRRETSRLRRCMSQTTSQRWRRQPASPVQRRNSWRRSSQKLRRRRRSTRRLTRHLQKLRRTFLLPSPGAPTSGGFAEAARRSPPSSPTSTSRTRGGGAAAARAAARADGDGVRRVRRHVAELRDACAGGGGADPKSLAASAAAFHLTWHEDAHDLLAVDGALQQGFALLADARAAIGDGPLGADDPAVEVLGACEAQLRQRLQARRRANRHELRMLYADFCGRDGRDAPQALCLEYREQVDKRPSEAVNAERSSPRACPRRRYRRRRAAARRRRARRRRTRWAWSA